VLQLQQVALEIVADFGAFIGGENRDLMLMTDPASYAGRKLLEN